MQRPLMTWGCEEGGWGEVGGWATVGCVAGLGVGGWGRLDLDDPRGGWRLGGGGGGGGSGCELRQLHASAGPEHVGRGLWTHPVAPGRGASELGAGKAGQCRQAVVGQRPPRRCALQCGHPRRSPGPSQSVVLRRRTEQGWWAAAHAEMATEHNTLTPLRLANKILWLRSRVCA